MNKEKGVITVFLALIYGILITFFCTLIDVTRINSTKNQLICATDAGITSALSNYDANLFNDYGLLTFKDSNEIKNTVRKYMKENVQQGTTNNNLFKIDVGENNIDVQSADSPFTNTKVMEHNMINAVKFKGTENLALGVFDLIKQLVSQKANADDTDKLQKLEDDKTKEKLDESIANLKQSQKTSLKTIVELAKNNRYEVIIQDKIGYITSINKKQLTSAYSTYYNGDIKKCINNVEEYDPQVTLETAYSYYYAKMILEMYEGALTTKIRKQKKESKKEKLEKKLEKVQGYITLIKRQYDDLYNPFLKTIEDYYNELQSEKEDGVDDLIENRQKYTEFIQKYKQFIDNANSKDYSQSLKDIYQKYSDTMKNIDKIKVDIDSVYAKTRSVILEVKSHAKKANNVLKDAKSWGKSNCDKDSIKKIEDIVDDASSNNIVEFLCKSKLKNDSNIKNFLNKIPQIETTKGIKVAHLSEEKVKKDNNNYKDFYDKIKKFAKKEKGQKGLRETLKKFDSKKKIQHNGLPNSESTTGSSSFPDLLSGIPSQMKDLSDSNSFLDCLGTIADKVYINEYIMTYFREMVQLKDPNKRIPELTTVNKNKLQYEIEAIVSGTYDDSSSKNTLLDDLILMRTSLNTISLFIYQKPIMKFIDAASAAVTAVLPIGYPIVKGILISLFVLLETRYDLIDIYNGYKVPLLKADTKQWCATFGINFIKYASKGSKVSDADIGKVDSGLDNKSDEDYSKPYNNQSYVSHNALGRVCMTYVDYIRIKLLTIDKDKLIRRCQDIITANEELKGQYSKYNTKLKVKVNNSNVNILFNTPEMKSKGSKNKFNAFKFERAYN